MIIFVGDKPSKKNIDPNIPFVGTQSYKRLLEWIWKMDINISDVRLCNKDGFVNTWMKNRSSKVIALGKEASRYVDGFRFTFGCEMGLMHPYNSPKTTYESEPIKIPFFELPHPSGLNRKINDKAWLDSKLKECSQWLSN